MDMITTVFIVVMVSVMVVLGLISLKAEPMEKDGRVRLKIKDRLAGYRPLVSFIVFLIALTAWIQADIGVLKISALIGRDFLITSLWISVRVISAILTTLFLLAIYGFARRIKLVYIYCRYTPKRYTYKKDADGLKFVRKKVTRNR